ncbi:MAG: SDR family NAD(P)-dependent oxidoreductase [Chloroflexota bacterium]
MRLEGKSAIVTGGASGIGEATARLFAGEGARVVIADVDTARGKAVAKSIVSDGLTARFEELDVVDEAAWQAVANRTVDAFGSLDVLINNAGVSGQHGRPRVEETTVEGWDIVMDVNAKGVFLGTKAAIPRMREAGGGAIINVSSIYGIVGSKSGTAYHASKGACRVFTKTAAIQCAPDNIRVNSVHPGFIDTPMTESLHAQPGVREERLGATPSGRLGTPDDIAYGILYLASDEARWVTGSELVIDGGMTAQ